MATGKITKEAVDALRPTTRDVYLWDRQLAGFGLKVTPAGRKVYLLQYRLGGRAGRKKRLTLGVHGSITPGPGAPACATRSGPDRRGHRCSSRETPTSR